VEVTIKLYTTGIVLMHKLSAILSRMKKAREERCKWKRRLMRPGLDFSNGGQGLGLCVTARFSNGPPCALGGDFLEIEDMFTPLLSPPFSATENKGQTTSH
jgi:hypothetical protein